MPGLPNADQAYIDPRKITDYLLSTSHPVGRGKAAFFMGFGFRADAPDELRLALLDHAAKHEVAHAVAVPHGSKYRLDGSLPTPDGRNPNVSTVWIVLNGTQNPTLVTAFPC